MSELNERDQELVALGAAIAGNCVPCVEHHVPEARRAGLTDGQIKHAFRVADRVRRFPARKVLRVAMSMIEEAPGTRGEEEQPCRCS